MFDCSEINSCQWIHIISIVFIYKNILLAISKYAFVFNIRIWFKRMYCACIYFVGN